MQADVVDIPAAAAVVLRDRTNAAFQRTFYFQNLTANALSLVIEESADGTTWSVLVPAFVVGIMGSGTEIIPKNIVSSNMLRVKGSGGGDDRDMLVTLVRGIVDANKVWAKPLI